MTYPASIPAIFGTVVEQVKTVLLADLVALGKGITDINYQTGSKKELKQTLQQMKDQAIPARFPLVWLVEPIEERRSDQGFYADVSLMVVIAHNGDKDKKSLQKEADVYTPILWPIYWELLNALAVTPAFNSPDAYRISHSKIDMKNASAEDGDTAQMFTTDCDAIIIRNMELRVNYTNCIMPINENM